MDMLFAGIGVLFVSKVVVSRKIFMLNRWREKKENEQHPMVAFDYVFLTLENSDIFPILTRRHHGMRHMGVTGCERKDLTSYLIAFSCRLENPFERR